VTADNEKQAYRTVYLFTVVICFFTESIPSTVYLSRMMRVLKFRFAVGVLVFITLSQACREAEPPPIDFAVDVGSSEIPYLVIDTRGNGIQFAPKTPATLNVYERKILVQEQRIAIEYRGKTSYRLSNKKGYNIETTDGAGQDADVSFFGFPAEEDWRLIGHVVNLDDKYIFDKTLMYNFVAYELSRSIGRYAARCKFVELELNGEYLGVYVFTEKPKRDNNRINIRSLTSGSTNLTGGYILTIDKASPGDAALGKPLAYFSNNWDDDARYTAQNSFRSRYDINRGTLPFPAYGPPYHPQKYLETYFLYEYPDASDITGTQKQYIANYMDQFETALLTDNFTTTTRTYTNFIDRSTFVDYFIINELCRNVDAYRLSTYLQKDRDGKLAMGPVWDFDIGFDNGGRIPMNDWVINYNRHVASDAWMMPFWWPRLMEDQQFRAEVKQRWQALRANALSNATLSALVSNTADYLKANGAVRRNYDKWDQGIGVNYDQSVSDLRQFLQQRAAWMDSKIGSF